MDSKAVRQADEHMGWMAGRLGKKVRPDTLSSSDRLTWKSVRL